ncbi:MAG: hypothetical protein MUO76_13705 [Anaerolineaceae bacterium]|nr:hypothetical protein [Anaerolineaceae bacterium]
MNELYLLPLNIKNGQEQPSLPGILVTTSPKGAERSRSDDVLILLLTLQNNVSPEPSTLDRMLQPTADTYFMTRGSITSGLRAAAEYLNSSLIKHNKQLGGKSENEQIFGILNLAVLRKNVLYIIHAGPTHTFQLSPDDFQDFHDPHFSGRGLGYGISSNYSYYQTMIKTGEMLIFCAQPPDIWTEETLLSGHVLAMNLLRRRLLAVAKTDFQAVITQFRSSKKREIHLLKPRVPLSQTGVKAERQPDPIPADPAHLERESAHPAEIEHPMSGPQFELQEEVPEIITSDHFTRRETHKEPASERKISGLARHPKDKIAQEEPVYRKTVRHHPIEDFDEQKLVIAPPKKAAAMVSRSREEAARNAAKAVRRQTRRKKMAARWYSFRNTTQKVTGEIKKIATRLLPGMTDQSPRISPVSMFIIAIVVPILVVAVASTIYLQKGRSQQFEVYLQQASEFAKEASNQVDPSLQRSNWVQAIYWLDIAEGYGTNVVSEGLRKQANHALDVLDGIIRLDFRPTLIMGFASSVDITNIVANDAEVYLLDSSQGRVIRMFLTGHGYELDNDFTCGPGISGTRMIGSLVDMVILPPGNPNNTSILSIDDSGNLLYCIPGSDAPLSNELIPPEPGWGEITAITYYQGSLYILDYVNDSIFVYRGYNMEFGEPPIAYFDPEKDAEIPDITDAVDLSIYGEDLYLLNDNGTITLCTSSLYENYQTRCDDPAPFGDLRPGREEETLLFPDAFFAQVITTEPPDPSLFLLDINSPSIDHFSLQLNLDRQLKPSLYSEPPTPDPPATAFSISPSRVVFLAYANQVYYASLP